jgi:cytochrome P450
MHHGTNNGFRSREQHAGRRRLMSRNFAQAPLMELVPSLMAKAEALCHQLEKIGTQGSVDVYPWLYRLGLEYICELSTPSQLV